MDLKTYYRKKLTISDVIDFVEVFNNDLENEFEPFPDIYGSDYTSPITLNLSCYLDELAEVIDDNEVYPYFIQDNNLSVICSGEVFIDVYDYIEQMNDSVDKELFIKELNYYLENDCFI